MGYGSYGSYGGYQEEEFNPRGDMANGQTGSFQSGSLQNAAMQSRPSASNAYAEALSHTASYMNALNGGRSRASAPQQPGSVQGGAWGPPVQQAPPPNYSLPSFEPQNPWGGGVVDNFEPAPSRSRGAQPGAPPGGGIGGPGDAIGELLPGPGGPGDSIGELLPGEAPFFSGYNASDPADAWNIAMGLQPGTTNLGGPGDSIGELLPTPGRGRGAQPGGDPGAGLVPPGTGTGYGSDPDSMTDIALGLPPGTTAANRGNQPPPPGFPMPQPPPGGGGAPGVPLGQNTNVGGAPGSPGAGGGFTDSSSGPQGRLGAGDPKYLDQLSTALRERFAQGRGESERALRARLALSGGGDRSGSDASALGGLYNKYLTEENAAVGGLMYGASESERDRALQEALARESNLTQRYGYDKGAESSRYGADASRAAAAAGAEASRYGADRGYASDVYRTDATRQLGLADDATRRHLGEAGIDAGREQFWGQNQYNWQELALRYLQMMNGSSPGAGLGNQWPEGNIFTFTP